MCHQLEVTRTHHSPALLALIPPFRPSHCHLPTSAEWGDCERKNKWVKERTKQGAVLHGHAPIGSSRAHFGFDFFLERTWEKKHAFVGVPKANSHAPESGGRGRKRWATLVDSSRLFSARTPALDRQTLWRHPVPLAYGSVPYRVISIGLASICPQLQTVTRRTRKQVQTGFSISVRSRFHTFTAPVVLRTAKVNAFTPVSLREMSSMHAQGHHLSSHSHDRVSARAFIVRLIYCIWQKCIKSTLFICNSERSEDGSLWGRRETDMHWPLPPPVARHEIFQVVKLRWSVVMCVHRVLSLIYLQTLWQKIRLCFCKTSINN